MDLSYFNISKVESMFSMFYGCTNLKMMNLPNFDTSKVKNMDSMFSSCSQLISLNLSNFNASNVTLLVCLQCFLVVSLLH